jgi:Mg2+ and Co2+ transporter CorA
LDSGTSRILTIVASVFLPTAFLVSLFLMPLNGVPLRKRKNAYWIFLAAILVIFVIMVTLFRKDFHAVLVG